MEREQDHKKRAQPESEIEGNLKTGPELESGIWKRARPCKKRPQPESGIEQVQNLNPEFTTIGRDVSRTMSQRQGDPENILENNCRGPCLNQSHKRPVEGFSDAPFKTDGQVQVRALEKHEDTQDPRKLRPITHITWIPVRWQNRGKDRETLKTSLKTIVASLKTIVEARA